MVYEADRCQLVEFLDNSVDRALLGLVFGRGRIGKSTLLVARMSRRDPGPGGPRPAGAERQASPPKSRMPAARSPGATALRFESGVAVGRRFNTPPPPHHRALVWPGPGGAGPARAPLAGTSGTAPGDARYRQPTECRRTRMGPLQRRGAKRSSDSASHSGRLPVSDRSPVALVKGVRAHRFKAIQRHPQTLDRVPGESQIVITVPLCGLPTALVIEHQF